MPLKYVSLFRALHQINNILNYAGGIGFRSVYTHFIFKWSNELNVNFAKRTTYSKSLCRSEYTKQTCSRVSARCMTETKSGENWLTGNQLVEDVCRFWTEILEKNDIPEARVSVDYIVAHVLGRKTMQGISGWHELNPQQMETVNAMCRQRLQHKPVQYILGEWDFHDIELKMKPPVFIPRPETEELVERAIDQLERNDLTTGHMLELCCGSGAITLALLHKFPGVRGIAVDISPEACCLTEQNAQRLGLSDRITVLTGDLRDTAVQDRLRDLGPFDLLVSNPPYIPTDQMAALEPHIVLYEDLGALEGGIDGLDVIRHVLHLAPLLLRPQCDILLEIQAGQPKLIKDIVSSTELSRLQFISSYLDYCDRERFCHLRTVGSQQPSPSN